MHPFPPSPAFTYIFAISNKIYYFLLGSKLVMIIIMM